MWMDQTLALLMMASFVVCASLLWFGVQAHEAHQSRTAFAAWGLMAASVTLTACGLWWPSHALSHLRGGAEPAVVQMLFGVLILLSAALAYAVGLLWRRGQEPWAMVAAVVMAMVVYAHLSMNLPVLMRAGSFPRWLVAGLLALSVCGALIFLQFAVNNKRHALRARAAACAAIAFSVCISAALSVHKSDLGQLFFKSEWLLISVLVATVGVLLAVMRADQQQSGVLPGDVAARSGVRSSRTSANDALTGLSNRRHFESRLHRAARECDSKDAESQSSHLAVFFVDLDGFKPINGSFGHAGGDSILKQAGRRLKALAAGAGPSGTGLAARISGDEFVLLCVGLADHDAAAALAHSIIDALSKPYSVDDREVTISCSVGIAPYPEKCAANKLIARAEAAMTCAKRAGGSRHCFYAAEMNADVQQNFDMLRELRQAILKDELELFFQPKIDALSGKITAAEALVRWNHPTRGLVMPAQFIALAERSGLIGALGNWVIEAACKQARAWRDKGLRMRVAINLSAYQMRQVDIADRIAESLARHRIRPSLLTCEITESAAMEDTRATQEAFRRLGELGTHLSIDDFGTGYSSLSYLRQLPAEELKIDASFIRDLDFSDDARAIIDAVVKLAHALGLKVVAEGVENQRQQKILIELGCDELQGYLFAQPMSARALLLWAMDDRSSSVMFRPSLFGETLTDKGSHLSAQSDSSLPSPLPSPLPSLYTDSIGPDALQLEHQALEPLPDRVKTG
jgi:diguanylate cyclase